MAIDTLTLRWVLLGLGLFGSAQRPAEQTPLATGAISGVVTDGATGAPLAGALVYLSGAGRTAADQNRQLTDDKGRFAFTNLRAAPAYSVTAAKPGYLDGGYGRHDLRDDVSAPIALSDGEWFANARVALWRPGSISGVVTDERGEPVVNVYVRALMQFPVAGRAQLGVGPMTMTDDHGAFRLSGLYPGKYLVQVPSPQVSVPASMSGFELAGVTPQALASYQASGRPIPTEFAIGFDATSQLVVGRYPTPPPPVNGRLLVYPPTFSPGSPAVAQASVMDLRQGEDRTADVRLDPVATGRLSGVVQGPPDSLLNLTLRLLVAELEDLGQGSETGTALVNTDGSFTFLGVPPGTYTIDAPRTTGEFTTVRFSLSQLTSGLPRPPGSTGGSMNSDGVAMGPPGTSYSVRDSRSFSAGNYWGRTTVTTDGRDQSGVVVTMRPAASMSGRIVTEADPGKPSAAPPTFMTVRLDPANASARLGRPRSRTPPGTEFAIEELLPGEYLVRGNAASGWIVKSVTWNGRDYADVPFDAASTQEFSGVTVTFTNAVPTISGAVRDGRGLAATSTAVIAFPVDHGGWSNYGFVPRRLRSVPTSNLGRFTFTTLPAGDYYLIAVPASQADAWLDPDFLKRAEPNAIRIRVDWGGTTTQDLRVRDDLQ